MEHEPERLDARFTWLAAGTGILAGLALLHGLLILLWPERTTHGFLMVADLSDDLPRVSWIVVLPWLAILVLGVLFRLRETHSTALDAWRWCPGDAFGSLARMLALYLGAAFAGAIVEPMIDFHFVTSISIYCFLATVLLGAIFAGRRRPFLKVSLTQTPGSRRRWIGSAIAGALLAAFYVEFLVDNRFWSVQYAVAGWLWWTILALLAVPGAMLGWAVLHSHLMDLLAWIVRKLEWCAGAVEAHSSVRIEHWLAHVGSAAAVLALLRGLGAALGANAPSRVHKSLVLLGVDWYFVKPFTSVTAAELFVLLAFVLITSCGRVPS